MHVYEVIPGQGVESLRKVSRPDPTPGSGEVVVRVRAVSLNFRDLMIAAGQYPGSTPDPRVPCSDGAGEVIAVGKDVTDFKPGDRVAANFFPHWVDGDPVLETIGPALGGSLDGMLAEQVALPARSLVRIPDHMDFVDAACMPCAGVTAWNALFETAGLKPGDTVLLQGTGGVSIWALQLAVAAGLRVIITSSSDDKLKRVKEMGAHETINYSKNPEWQDVALQLTGGRGVDSVVEVGGKGTLPRSLGAVRMRGVVSVIGGLSGFDGDLGPISLIVGAKQLCGIYVGSRRMFEDLATFTALKQIRPVVDRAFGFDEAAEAYGHMAASRHFGKVAIKVG